MRSGSSALVLLAIAAALAVGCAGDDDAPPTTPAQLPTTTEPPATAVTIRYDPDGDGAVPSGARRVVCPGAGAEERQICRRLALVPPKTFTPVPDDVACTLIYGGPQTGRITGTIGGRRVDARFDRRNGCEDARYRAVASVLRSV